MPDMTDYAQEEDLLFTELAIRHHQIKHPAPLVPTHCRNCGEKLEGEHHGSCCSRECRDDLQRRERAEQNNQQVKGNYND